MTREFFRDHYERVHAPLALPLLAGLERYVRHHVRGAVFGDVPFDCMTSFWWRDGAALGQLMARLQSPEAADLRGDERGFMNKEAEIFFPVEERATVGSEPADLLVLASNAANEAVGAFHERFTREHLPALEACRVQLTSDQRGLPIGDRPPRFDRVVLSSGFDPSVREAVERWAADVAGQGVSLLVCAVSEHESVVRGAR